MDVSKQQAVHTGPIVLIYRMMFISAFQHPLAEYWVALSFLVRRCSLAHTPFPSSSIPPSPSAPSPRRPCHPPNTPLLHPWNTAVTPCYALLHHVTPLLHPSYLLTPCYNTDSHCYVLFQPCFTLCHHVSPLFHPVIPLFSPVAHS